MTTDKACGDSTVDWEAVKAADYLGMSAKERETFDAGVQDKKLAMEISDTIYRARTRAGLTQAQLAEQVGINQQAISDIERTAQTPTTTMLTKLAVALDTTFPTQTRSKPHVGG